MIPFDLNLHLSCERTLNQIKNKLKIIWIQFRVGGGVGSVKDLS